MSDCSCEYYLNMISIQYSISFRADTLKYRNIVYVVVVHVHFLNLLPFIVLATYRIIVLITFVFRIKNHTLDHVQSITCVACSNVTQVERFRMLVTKPLRTVSEIHYRLITTESLFRDASTKNILLI